MAESRSVSVLRMGLVANRNEVEILYALRRLSVAIGRRLKFTPEQVAAMAFQVVYSRVFGIRGT